MDNIFGVTKYLRSSHRRDGGDLDRECYYPGSKQKAVTAILKMKKEQPWRCLHYVPNYVCYQQVEKPEQFYQSASLSFGHFLKQLGDYPAESLYETIPQFHDTRKRFRDFEDAQRKGSVKNKNPRFAARSIDFVLSRKDDCGVLMNQLERGRTAPLCNA